MGLSHIDVSLSVSSFPPLSLKNSGEKVSPCENEQQRVTTFSQSQVREPRHLKGSELPGWGS